MNINRNNYEEYFILYMDNELDSVDRRRVEEFVQLHPDLQEELELLMQTRLVPDESVVFRNKEELLLSSSINLSNYEEWLVLYIDNELSAEQRISVEAFAATHPAVQKELNLFQLTRLPAEEIVFPGKDSLYQKEEKTRPIVWWRIAAAAVLFVAAGSTVWLVTKNNKDGIDTPQGTTASATNSQKNDTNPEKNITLPGNTATLAENNEERNTVPAITPANENKPVQDKEPVLTKQTDKPGKLKQQPEPVENPAQEKLKEDLAIGNKPSNNLPKPENNPNVNTPVNQNNKITESPFATADNRAVKQDPNNSPVTSLPNDTYKNADEPANAKQNEDVIFASNAGKKGKLRGFFRKVTRTFEKRTNIDPTDDDDRLLVGGLAIKLK